MFVLALPNGGRLAQPVKLLMQQAGLILPEPSRILEYKYQHLDLHLVFIRPKDAPKLVASGVIDLAVCAEDILAEQLIQLRVVEKLGLAKCTIALCVPQNSPFQTAQALEGYRVASCYPNLTSRWFGQQNIALAEIRTMYGALEVAPCLNYASAIVDSYQTGTSARAHGLSKIATLMNSEAILISRSCSDLVFPDPVLQLLDKIKCLTQKGTLK